MQLIFCGHLVFIESSNSHSYKEKWQCESDDFSEAIKYYISCMDECQQLLVTDHSDWWLLELTWSEAVFKTAPFGFHAVFCHTIVPGPPLNLIAELSLDDCTRVVLKWAPPASDEQNGKPVCAEWGLNGSLLWFDRFLHSGVIRKYRVRVSARDTSGYEETFVNSSNAQPVTGLQCCSDYQFTVSAFTFIYGAPAGDVMFRTFPDLSSM